MVDETQVPTSAAREDIILPDSPCRVSELETDIASPPRQVVPGASSRQAPSKIPPPKQPTAPSRQSDHPPAKSRSKAAGQKIASAKPTAPPTSSAQDLALSTGKFSRLPPPPAETPTAALQTLRATVSSFMPSGSREVVAASAPGGSGVRVVEEYNKSWIAADASEIVEDLHAAGPSRSAQALHALQVAALDVTRVVEVSLFPLPFPKFNCSIPTSPRDWCLVL